MIAVLAGELRRVKLRKSQKLYAFGVGQVFGYIRWKANKYGTVDWRLYICQASLSGQVTRVPGIIPGAKVLLSVHGNRVFYRYADLDAWSGGNDCGSGDRVKARHV